MSAENFDSNDTFHVLLGHVNWEHSTGNVIAIVWSQMNHDTPGYSAGMVITQNGAAMASRRFSVHHTKESYTLKFLGKTRQVQDDYFE